MSVRSVDSQTLDVLASPKTLAVRLRRHVKYFPDARQVKHSQRPTVEVADIETAIWWSPSDATGQGTYERRIEGEIHLPKALQPSSDFPLLVVEVITSIPTCHRLF